MRISTFVRFRLRADDEPLEVLCSLGGSSAATCRCKSQLDIAAIGASFVAANRMLLDFSYFWWFEELYLIYI